MTMFRLTQSSVAVSRLRRLFAPLSLATVCALLIAVCSAATAVADESDQVVSPTPEQEKQFSDSMSNTTLTGRFTFDDKMNAVPKPERYEIKSVTKAVGNLWIFMVRIKYGKVDANVPVTVPVVWADGTPMVSLKNATIPGMGSGFSAHVIFEGSRYAGTWQHNSKGGHMFGTIEKTKEAIEADAESKPRTNKAKADKI
ncbi:MAG: hypothetical protein ABJZ55_09400 [Fuerstiella sp.]